MKVIVRVGFVLFLLCVMITAANAERCRIVDGEGVLTDDLELVESIWKIGVGKINPSGEYGYELAELCGDSLPGELGREQKFFSKTLEDIDPSTMTAEEIIKLGQEKDVDAILGGTVNQAKFKSSWNANFRVVRIECSFYLYETRNGNRVWERTLKKDREVPIEEAQTIFRRFCINMAEDCALIIVEDGIRGRDTSLNLAPVCADIPSSIPFVTSVYRFRSKITDDLGMQSLNVIMDVGTPIYSLKLNGETECAIDTIVYRNQMEDSHLIVTCVDTQGAESEWEIGAEIMDPIEASVANIVGETLFISAGTSSGVTPGLLFQVETKTEIVDPSTGKVLGTTELVVGMLEVTSVDENFAQCKLVEGDISSIAIGSRIF